MTERIEDVAAVNPVKGKKKSASKSPSKPHSGKKRAKKGSHKGSAKKSSSRRRRRKNPSVDMKGLAAAAVGGALTELVSTPAARGAGMLVKKEGMGRQAARAGGGAVMGAVAALGLSFASPSMAKGAAGVAGSQATRNLLAGAAFESKDANGILHKAGFDVLPLPDGVYVKDGQLFKKDATGGGEKLLLGFQVRPIELEMTDGSRRPASLLGQLDEGALVMDQEGEVRLLAGAIVSDYPNPQAGAITPSYANPQAGPVRGRPQPTSGEYNEDSYQ